MSEARSIRHLRDYVAIPSVNPMQRDDIPADVAGERRYAEHVREQLRALKLDAELVGDAERPSVMAEAHVAGARDTVLVASHLDTVPVDHMEIPPFDPSIRDGRMYGRGTCDTKAGMAALLDALQTVLERGTLARNVIVVGEADEELGSQGVRDVAEALGTRRPDWMIATEPTSLRVVTHHKGIAHARLRAHGVACHSSRPEEGRNAIVDLSRAVLALDGLAEELSSVRDPHLGPATISVGLVGGGTAANVVPDEAWLVMDWRLLPGQDEATVRTEVGRVLAAAGLDGVAIESVSIEKDALGTDPDHASVRALQRALADAGLDVTPDVAAFGTDAGPFATRGIPGVVFGPGSIAQAHTATEWVDCAQVEAAADVFVRLLEGP